MTRVSSESLVGLFDDAVAEGSAISMAQVSVAPHFQSDRPQFVLARDAVATAGRLSPHSRMGVVAVDGPIPAGMVWATGKTLKDMGTIEEAPFVLAALADARNISSDDAIALEAHRHRYPFIAGCMVKGGSTGASMRATASFCAAGYDTATIGAEYARELVTVTGGRVPLAVVVVVGDEEVVASVEEALVSSEDYFAAVLNRYWRERGIDLECSSGFHCGACKDKDTCVVVRQIQGQAARKRAAAQR